MSTTRDTSRPVGRPNLPLEHYVSTPEREEEPDDLELKRIDAQMAIARYREARKANHEPR